MFTQHPGACLERYLISNEMNYFGRCQYHRIVCSLVLKKNLLYSLHSHKHTHKHHNCTCTRNIRLKSMTKCDKEIIRLTRISTRSFHYANAQMHVHFKHKHYSNHLQLIKFYRQLYIAFNECYCDCHLCVCIRNRWVDGFVFVLFKRISCAHVISSIRLYDTTIFSCNNETGRILKTPKIDLGKLVLFTLIVAKCIPTTYAYNSFISVN